MSIQWLKPKGLWGYLGVALFSLILAAVAAQYIWHPYWVLSAAEVSNVQDLLQQLYTTALFYKSQCSAS